LDFLSGAGGNPSDFDVTSIKTELVPWMKLPTATCGYQWERMAQSNLCRW
jgi:hypothetical protein